MDLAAESCHTVEQTLRPQLTLCERLMVLPPTELESAAVVGHDNSECAVVALHRDGDARWVAVLQCVDDGFMHHERHSVLNLGRKRFGRTADGHWHIPLERDPFSHRLQLPGERPRVAEAGPVRSDCTDEDTKLPLLDRQRAFDGAEAIPDRRRVV